MTKNNEYILPKEVNKKPFETVYELKNEVPSFEEFVKTYEGSVNYADLNGGDVGEVKGYGPCSPSYCNNCSCPRSDCNCESGERYIKLCMPCPAVKKDSYGNITRCATGVSYENRTNWVHSVDSYYTGISNHANIRCEKSYCSATNKMQNGKFLCSNHSFHEGKYLSAATETGIDVVTTAGRAGGDSQLIVELLIGLNKPENRF